MSLQCGFKIVPIIRYLFFRRKVQQASISYKLLLLDTKQGKLNGISLCKNLQNFPKSLPIGCHSPSSASKPRSDWLARATRSNIPVRFHEFFDIAARTLKNAGVRAPLVTLAALERATGSARAGPTGVCRVLGPWRTLDAPESPRVGCNCGLVALELARFQCRLDSKYLESTSHLIQCVSRSESLSTGKPTAITYQILPKQLTTTRASAPPWPASQRASTARVVESLEQQSDIKNYFDIVQHKQECLIQTREPFQPIRPKRGS